jgi:hypothetical protein
MFSAVNSQGKSEHKKYYNAKRKSRKENWHVKVWVYFVAATCLFGYVQLKPQIDGFAHSAVAARYSTPATLYSCSTLV